MPPRSLHINQIQTEYEDNTLQIDYKSLFMIIPLFRYRNSNYYEQVLGLRKCE